MSVRVTSHATETPIVTDAAVDAGHEEPCAPEQLQRVRAREHAPGARAAAARSQDEVREREQQQRDGGDGGQEEGERRSPPARPPGHDV